MNSKGVPLMAPVGRVYGVLVKCEHGGEHLVGAAQNYFDAWGEAGEFASFAGRTVVLDAADARVEALRVVQAEGKKVKEAKGRPVVEDEQANRERSRADLMSQVAECERLLAMTGGDAVLQRKSLRDRIVQLQKSLKELGT